MINLILAIGLLVVVLKLKQINDKLENVNNKVDFKVHQLGWDIEKLRREKEDDKNWDNKTNR